LGGGVDVAAEMAFLGPVLCHVRGQQGGAGIRVSLLQLTMNKTNRTITVAHPLSVLGAFVFRAFSTKVAGGTDSPVKGGHGAYREASTAAQAARLSQAFGHGWSSNPRTSASRLKVAA
jgi:hypothetical protein